MTQSKNHRSGLMSNSATMALAMLTAITRNIGDPIHHQHGRFGQLGIAGAEQFTARAFQQVFAVETG